MAAKRPHEGQVLSRNGLSQNRYRASSSVFLSLLFLLTSLFISPSAPQPFDEPRMPHHTNAEGWFPIDRNRPSHGVHTLHVLDRRCQDKPAPPPKQLPTCTHSSERYNKSMQRRAFTRDLVSEAGADSVTRLKPCRDHGGRTGWGRHSASRTWVRASRCLWRRECQK